MNGKILIVDNEPHFLDATARYLEVSGYEVYRAISLEQARQLLDYTWVHVALIDIRLRDDEDTKDASGLQLARDAAYLSIPKIMMTQFPSYEYVRDALGPNLDGLTAAVDFLDKRGGAESILRALEQTFEQRVRLNQDLTITWSQLASFPHLVNMIQPELDRARLLDRAGELEDLFHKLFYQSKQITIGRVLKHSASQLLLEVFAYGQAGNERQFVVSCGKKEQIVDENRRYDDVVPHGAGVGGTVKQPTAQTLRFAATPYMLVGGDLEEMVSFREYYHRCSADALALSLNHLYSVTLPSWYQRGREQQPGANLSELYARGLGLDAALLAPDALGQRVEAIGRQMLAAGLVAGIDITTHSITLRFATGESFIYANPITEHYNQHINPSAPALYGVVHGNIGPDSILVDSKGQTWLIDFTRAGRGLLLQDFIVLETKMKLEMLETLDLQTRNVLEQRLLEAAMLDNAPMIQDLPPELQRIASAIHHIRASAADLTGDHLTSYQVGMFFCTLKYVATYDPALHYARRKLIPYAHALMLAAMLYETLVTPPDQAQNQPLPVLRLDKPNQIAWLGDRQIDLTSREFQLLAFLYERAGRLCTRRAIATDMLDIEYGTSDESWLNSLLNRLRRKIEPDPDHPAYLLTVRGRGYKLMVAPGVGGIPQSIEAATLHTPPPSTSKSQSTVLVQDDLISSQQSDLRISSNTTSNLTHEFFVMAGFTVDDISPDTLRVKSNATRAWERYGSIIIRCFETEVLSSEQLLSLHDDIDQLQGSNRLAFVVGGKIASDAAGTMWKSKQDGLVFVPLHRSIIGQALNMGDSGDCYRILSSARDNWSSMDDPYVRLDPITDPQWFIGRAHLIEEITQSVTRATGKPLAIWGMRRIGKTALLNQIELSCLRQGYPIVKWLCKKESVEISLYNIARDFQRIIAQLHPVADTLPIVSSDEYQSNPVATFRRDLSRLHASVERDLNSDTKLILLIDEMEINGFFPGEASEDEDYQRYYNFAQAIKEVLETKESANCLSLVVAAEYPWIDKINHFPFNKHYQNPLYKRFSTKLVSFLSEEESNELVQRLGDLIGLQYDSLSLRRIYEEARGHPQINRSLCSCILGVIESATSNGQRHVTSSIIDQAVERLLVDDDGEGFRNYFEHIFWQNPLSPNIDDDQQILAVLAQRGTASIQELEQHLRDSSVDNILFAKRDFGEIVNESVNRLSQLGLVEAPQSEVYKLRIPLFTQWIHEWKITTIFEGGDL